MNFGPSLAESARPVPTPMMHMCVRVSVCVHTPVYMYICTREFKCRRVRMSGKHSSLVKVQEYFKLVIFIYTIRIYTVIISLVFWNV